MLGRLFPGLLLVVVAVGCEGKALFQKDVDGEGPPSAEVPEEVVITPTGMHRLTRDEYDNSLFDLLADDTRSGQLRLPEDVTDPFDNDFRNQRVSGALVEAVEGLAQDAAARALADPGKRDALVQCQPEGPGDEACLKKFIESFGRRALRQPLGPEDMEAYLGFSALAVEANDFWVGVDLVIRAMLQDPRFLYRPEVGTPADEPGVVRLTAFEIATRLSYFIWGSTPPDWLLDQAAAGALETPDQLAAAAERMLNDPRAQERIDRFHALWLGYHQLPHSAELTSAMRQETAALVKKVVFEDDADYFQLFKAESTYVNPMLATHYGLPAPEGTGFSWVSYGGSGRQGILSHGSVLSQGAKFSDTSPTQRGIFVRNRLLCQEIPPPPANVNADLPPESSSGGNCKKDRYSDHANVGSCAACHQKVDPIGWGLENYDKEGQYRIHDDGDASCTIDGEGKITEYGTFNGPDGLADLLIASGELEHCIATQVFRFAHGKREVLADAQTIDRWVTAWKEDDRSFRSLVMAVVADPTFVFRKEE